MDKYMIRYYKIAGRNHIFYMCFLSRKHSKASALQTFGLIKLLCDKHFRKMFLTSKIERGGRVMKHSLDIKYTLGIK